MKHIMQVCRWSIFLAWCLTAGTTSAQMIPPEALIDSAKARLVARDWAAFTGYMHSTALQEFKFYLMKITNIREQGEADDSRFIMIFGRPTTEEIQNAPGEILFANFLSAAVAAVPEFGQVLTQTKLERLGVVDEGSEIRHVVVRRSFTFDGNIIRTVEVITLQKEGTGWKMLLPPAIKTFIDELGWPVIAN